MSVRYRSSIILTFILCTHFSSPVCADSTNDLAALELEELLSIEVISASKYPQKIADSPNAMHVITQDDIERSGATALPDLLRAVPAFERLTQTSDPFGIDLQQQHLVYYQPGMENDAGRLFAVLEAMCDLADAVGSYAPR